MKTNLLTSVLDTAFPDINYFQGRLLTARDMREQQLADKHQLQHHGRAIGAGVIEGLEVAISRVDSENSIPALKITAGVALNGRGDTLELATAHELLLLRSFDELPQDAGVFKQCVIPETQYDLFGTGVYILVMAPASGYKEYAPKTGLDEQSRSDNCGRRYLVEGVQFRLEKLEAINITGVSASTANSFNELQADNTGTQSYRFRNLLAHLCFGTEKQAGQSIAVDQHNAVQQYGALDDLQALQRYEPDSEIALAILHWDSSGKIAFVDQWSVRRQPYTVPSAADWANLQQARLNAQALAVLYQFQDNIEDMIGKVANLADVSAQGLFAYLPPVGFLPTASNQFDWQTFFGKHAPKKTIALDKGLLHNTLQQALLAAPVAVIDNNAAIPYKIYQVSGASDYVFFVRSHYAAVTADEVYFDGSACDLPAASSVQDALQQLCLNKQCLCTVMVGPETDFKALLASFTANSDIHICFQAGTYQLDETLVFKNLRHVHLSGAGQATRLYFTGEAVILLEACASVQMHDMFLHSGAVSSGNNLKGAVTGINCAQVNVYRIAVDSGSASFRAACCINFRNSTASSGSSICIEKCHCLAGNRQVGILVVNYDNSQIINNQIGLATARSTSQSVSVRAVSQGIVVGGIASEQVQICYNRLDGVIQGIHIGLSHAESSSGTADHLANVTVTDNAINNVLPVNYKGERHALFVGNCNSLLIRNNNASLQRLDQAVQKVEGIRLYGYYGRRVLVQANSLQDYTNGIRLTVLNTDLQSSAKLWKITDNLLANASRAIVVQSTDNSVIVQSDNLT